MSNFYSLKRAYEKLIKEQSGDEPMPDETESEEIEFRLSNDIADELTKTLNSFTIIAAKIVKNKFATKTTMKKFQNSYSKIRNLIDAAKNTNLKNREE